MIWKDIIGTPYAVSECGDVVRTSIGSNGKGAKLLTHRITRTGYHRVLLCFDNKQIDKYIHKLVAEAFVPNPRSYTEVNHRDGNKGNNYHLNLEWVSHSMNQQHAAMSGRLNTGRKLTEDNVIEIKTLLKTNKTHEEIARLFNVTKGTITDINTGRSWRYITI